MIQQLLRGRIFYVALSAFVVALLLYGNTLSLIVPQETAVSVAVEETESADWLVADIDGEWLRRAAFSNLRVAFSFIVLGLFVAGMVIGGIFLFVWGITTGRIRGIFRATFHRPPKWTFGELIRIALLTGIILCLLPYVRLSLFMMWPEIPNDNQFWMTASMLIIDGFMLLTIFTFAAGKSKPIGRAFGFSWNNLSGPISTGFRGYVALFPWLFLVLFLVVEVARQLGMELPAQPIHELLFFENRPSVLFMTIMLACFVGPIAEELFFRGVLYPALRQRNSRLFSMLISGAMFSGIHTNMIGFIPILLLGCLLADMYERTGSLAGPIAIHILHNTFLLSLALTYRAVAQPV